MIYKILAIFLMAFTAQAATTQDYQTWVPVNINAKLGDTNWRGFLEIQPRITNDSSTLGVAIVRPAVGYAITPKASIWLGYLMQASEIGDTNDYLIENRIWQGFTWKEPVTKNLTVEARNRLEERFIPHNSDVSLRWRTRVRAEYVLPIYTPVSLIASEELFVNINDSSYNPSLNSGIAQNRAYVGVGYRFAPQFQIETGYLNQYQPGNAGKPDQANNVWMTNLNFNF